MRRLTRRSRPDAGAPAPVRAVHLGLGAFHRAHQAWYTHRANQLGGAPTGIAAFTGRRPDAAVPLAEQDGLYGLLVRGTDGDQVDVVASISGAYDGTNVDELARRLADLAVGVVTTTVTEAGYRTEEQMPHTAPGRLLAGLGARRDAGTAPIAVVPCDNLRSNGAVVRTVLRELAERVDPPLVDYLDESVSFVSTTVDRITPATTDADRAVASEALGRQDHATVVTEPFTEWVLAGDFPAGRPDWDLAGARFVDDVEPFELRKLYLLNGAHSLLAYAGLARGHVTMAEAVDDADLRDTVGLWWREASHHVALPEAELTAYTEALLARFANPRLRHLLRQVATDGSQKLPIRVLPVVRAERAAGRLPAGGAYALGAWIAHVRGAGGAVVDPRSERLATAAAAPDGVRAVLASVAPDLVDDGALVDAVTDACAGLSAS